MSALSYFRCSALRRRQLPWAISILCLYFDRSALQVCIDKFPVLLAAVLCYFCRSDVQWWLPCADSFTPFSPPSLCTYLSWFQVNLNPSYHLDSLMETLGGCNSQGCYRKRYYCLVCFMYWWNLYIYKRCNPPSVIHCYFSAFSLCHITSKNFVQ